MLSKLTWPNYKGSPRDGVKYILEDGCDLTRAEYTFGRSKVSTSCFVMPWHALSCFVVLCRHMSLVISS